MSKRYIPVKERWQHHHEPTILSFVAGWINAVGFIALFGIYTNHVTGYIITASKETILGGIGVWALLLFTFICTIGFTAWFEKRWQHKFPNILLTFLIFETIFLILFMLAGVYFGPFETLSQFGTIATAMLGIIAMGIRNAIIRTLLSSMATSTLMTGNIAQLTIDIITIYGLSNTTNEEKYLAKKNISKILPTVLSFSSGAILGAIGYLKLSFFCILIPIILMVYICYREWVGGYQKNL
ncbi:MULTISPECIES: YoaK family protein [Acinetobacter]|uniref:YoaK family protein n=1 Tax=Acinetobacter TaxID=469 RepID=UPI00097F9F26|nr:MULTISPECIES: YoaK family protein [Acinetobacter]MEB3795779.1 DUF1275 domain-containing protein [Acinetobacter sp. IK24]MEB3814928.1 DUF1275 domain-containing protein [Acinetobacter sp. IK22]MEB3834127.1 DUF1275 domain-containing protein [Acinetobacter sp. IK23]MEB3838118.1 DUF1275 domain-containing protein [Acinetobacter sp. IK25]ONN53353.1 hypothetical protein AC057_14800 [Acinetobacter genomosp. 33YU]